ncbi:MAG: hypothetical protein ACM33B_14425 [Pseudomonadota bacterium]
MPDGPQPPRDADVLVDVDLERGLLFLALVNLGELPAHRVRVRIDPPLRGLGGRRRIDRLALFRRLELLAPGKRIRTVLDRPELLFARGEPTRFTATATWRTDAGGRGRRVVHHDLEVYRDLAVPDPEVPHRAREA